MDARWRSSRTSRCGTERDEAGLAHLVNPTLDTGRIVKATRAAVFARRRALAFRTEHEHVQRILGDLEARRARHARQLVVQAQAAELLLDLLDAHDDFQ